MQTYINELTNIHGIPMVLAFIVVVATLAAIAGNIYVTYLKTTAEIKRISEEHKKKLEQWRANSKAAHKAYPSRGKPGADKKSSASPRGSDDRDSSSAATCVTDEAAAVSEKEKKMAATRKERNLRETAKALRNEAIEQAVLDSVIKVPLFLITGLILLSIIALVF